MLMHIYLYFRGRIHNKSTQDIDNFIQLIPNLILLHQRKDLFHKCAVQNTNILTVLHKFHDNFRFLAWSWSHLFRQIGNSL
jgi:hypothetical protein